MDNRLWVMYIRIEAIIIKNVSHCAHPRTLHNLLVPNILLKPCVLFAFIVYAYRRVMI